MMLSVIVPTCNRPEDLRACLRQLSPNVQKLPPDQYEVIVSDDGRRQPARVWCAVEFPWVTVVDGPCKGPAANRNRGAEFAKYEWLVFIDDDCLPEPEWLEEYFDAIHGADLHKLAVFQGPTLRSSDPPSLLWESPHNPDGQNYISANFMISKQVYQAVGKFDERFPSAAIEDTEFFWRIRFLGGTIHLVTTAIVYHPLRKIGSALSLAKKWEGKVIWALDQGASPTTIAWRLPWHVFRVIASRFRGTKMSFDNVKAAFLFSGEWLYVAANTRSWIRKWSKNPRSRFWVERTTRLGPPPRYGF